MSEYNIINYTDDMHERVAEFLTKVFPESDKSFEPDGRHSAFADITIVLDDTTAL